MLLHFFTISVRDKSIGYAVVGVLRFEVAWSEL
jgi:hypothetical protein